MSRHRRIATAVVVLALGGALLSACSTSGERAAGPASPSSVTTPPASGRDASCTPTAPNGQSPPGQPPSEQYFGNGELYTILWPDGVVVFEPGGPGELREDGSIVMKWPFVRGERVSGQVTVEGRSLHRPGRTSPQRFPTGTA